MKLQRVKTYLPVAALVAAFVLLVVPHSALPQGGSGDLPKSKPNHKRSKPNHKRTSSRPPVSRTMRAPRRASPSVDDEPVESTPVEPIPVDPREEVFAARPVPRLDPEAVKLIRDNHVDGVDLSNRLGEDLRRLSSYLDPFSTYLTVEQVTGYRGSHSADMTEFGALIAGTSGPEIAYELALIKGSPGGRGREILWRINRTDTKDLSLYDVRQLLSGRLGTKVNLDVEGHNPGSASARVTEIVTRDVLNYIPAEGRLEAGSVGVITVGNLTDGEAQSIRAQVMALLRGGAKQILLDLRDVAGGSFNEGVLIANFFVGKGVLAKKTGRGGKALQVIDADPSRVIFEGPLLVVINEGTAGPAELTALIIKESGRGMLVNDSSSWIDRKLRNHSFGAGGEQYLFVMNRGDGLLLTTMQWTAKSGTPFLKDGVKIDKNMNMKEAIEFLSKGRISP